MPPFRTGFVVAAISVMLPHITPAQNAQRPPLGANDISDITTLVMLEDQRTFDSTALARILASTHPEVRRRATLSLGRIVDPRSRVLLTTVRGDRDTAVLATAAFSTGQLFDTSSIGWLDSLLSSPATAPTAAREAAGALGKIRTPEARAALERFLTSARAGARTTPAIREALLSIGRYTTRGDLQPIIRWAVSPDVETRWRAAWALFRPRDPAAVPHLLRLSGDASPVVRNWAVRGLVLPQLDSSGVARATAITRLVRLASDPDRTVRTEAIRALGTFPEQIAINTLYTALRSDDVWLSVSAAEALGRHAQFAATSIARLTEITQRGDSNWLSQVAASSRNSLLATRDSTPAAGAGRGGARGGGGGGGRTGGGARAGGGGGGGGGRGRGPVQTGRTETDYRQIVERWVVPDYNGAPRPRVEWTTNRGRFVLELYPGDAPIGVTDFMRNMESGALIGLDFSRVVPDFVDQQRGIMGHPVVRDEVNRNRLTRANLSWASAGLDTGRPGYTLGHTPQPHNEGGFTSLGRVVSGMDVVDRIQLGDRITAVRVLTTGRE